MTFREKIVVLILLLVARMFEADPQFADEIKALSTRISVHRNEVTA